MSENYRNLEIKTDEITLTALTEDFSGRILAENSGNVRDFFIPFENKQQVQTWVKTNLELMENGSKIELAILNSSQEFVGMISIRDLKTDPIFGLWISPKMQNQGYAKKSMKVFLKWLFENTNLIKLRYTADIKNSASIALAKSLNGKYLRDFIDEDAVECSEFIFEKNILQSKL